MFRVAPRFNLKELEKLFRYRVLKMLLGKGRITEEFVRMMDGWRHSGFNVFAGERIQPREKKSLENLAAYLIRSSFSQRRMEYLPQEAKVLYQSKDGKENKTYSAPEWLAAMGTHLPDRGQQCVRYYGAYANSTRGRLRKRQLADPIPTVLEPVISSEQFRKNWARLIQKVFEVDPLVCTHCQDRLRVVSFIEEPGVIRRILEHLGLWLANARPIPKAHSPPLAHLPSDPCFSQLPPREEEDFSQLPPSQWEC
jgi:hypothetical protein